MVRIRLATGQNGAKRGIGGSSGIGKGAGQVVLIALLVGVLVLGGCAGGASVPMAPTSAPNPAGGLSPTSTVQAHGNDNSSGVAELTVEEYAIVDKDEGAPDRMEYMQAMDPQIREKRQFERSRPAHFRAESISETLAKFGYELKAKEKPGCPTCEFFDLYKGDTVVQADLNEVRLAGVADNGEDFALGVWRENGESMLIRRDSAVPWDYTRHAGTPPVFVGGDLISLETEDLKHYVVKRGDETEFSFEAEFMVDNPVKGLWGWDGHWVLEVAGQVYIDGQSLNDQLGCDEIFGYRLLRGQPFYFFEKDNHIGVHYAGQVLPQQYDEVVHYQCCEPAAFNAAGNEHMVWFHALRGDMWHYVEMGIYDGQSAPPAAGNDSTTAKQPVTTQTPWQRLTIPEAGISFEVGEEWEQLSGEWTWLTGRADGQRVGVNWHERQQGWEPTAMLPNHAVTAGAEPVDLDWGTGASYTVEISQPAAADGDKVAYEKHVIVLTDAMAYDFFLSGRSTEELLKYAHLVEHMLKSATSTEDMAQSKALQTASTLAEAKKATGIEASEPKYLPDGAQPEGPVRYYVQDGRGMIFLGYRVDPGSLAIQFLKQAAVDTSKKAQEQVTVGPHQATVYTQTKEPSDPFPPESVVTWRDGNVTVHVRGDIDKGKLLKVARSLY